uniref:PDZ domain-containing protein n=1 Tax=Ditylum brightwellii TaxID=49249 RepID=A0A7S4RFZ3_9STRA
MTCNDHVQRRKRMGGKLQLFLLLVSLVAFIDFSAANENAIEDRKASDDVGDGEVLDFAEILGSSNYHDSGVKEVETNSTELVSDDGDDESAADVSEETTPSSTDPVDNDEDGPVIEISEEITPNDVDEGDSTSPQEGTLTAKNADGAGHVMLDEINESNAQDKMKSTVISSTITLSLSAVKSEMDSSQQAVFDTAIANFLEKIFTSQDKYDIEVRSISIVKQVMLYSEEESARFLEGLVGEKFGTLELDIVIVAELKPQGDQQLDNEDLGKIVVHVCERFEEHLVKRLKELGPFFEMVDRAITEYHSIETKVSLAVENPAEMENVEDDSAFAVIIGVTVGCVALAFAVVGSVLYIRRTKKKDLLPTRKISSKWSTSKSSKSKSRSSRSRSTSKSSGNDSDRPITIEFKEDLPEPKPYPYGPKRSDPYSPNSYNKIYHKKDLMSMLDSKSKSDSKKRSSRGKDNTFQKTEDFIPSIEDVKSRSLDSMGSDTIEFELNHSRSYDSGHRTRMSTDASLFETDLLKSATRRECTAPPGKLGVAIDTVNGQPVVHRIKPGSPLDGTLHRFDKIVAIDGVDTTGMSAADVTQLMVKRMNSERKISYIRGGDKF